MGFFSGILGSQKTQMPATGFYSQPESYQNAYNTVAGNVNSTIGNVNAGMFTPQPLTTAEQGAIGNINQGFTPTQDSLNADIGMQMNPFDQYVIDAINREGQGQNSILQQNLQGAGQSGSNRQLLGANDIDLSRMQQIGGFKQNQYNQALQNALTTLTGSRRQDAAAQLGTGDFLRNLDLQTKQAPVAAAGAQEQLLGGLPTQFGNFGAEAYTQKTGGGLGGLLGGLSTIGGLSSGAGGLATAAGATGLGSALSGLGSLLAFSDIRLKEDIKLLGEENGHNVYTFSYINDPLKKVYKGVMAHEVEKTNPDAVVEINGFKAVDYDKIGIEFKEVA